MINVECRRVLVIKMLKEKSHEKSLFEIKNVQGVIQLAAH